MCTVGAIHESPAFAERKGVPRIVGTGGLAVARSRSGESDYQSFSNTLAPLRYLDCPFGVPILPSGKGSNFASLVQKGQGLLQGLNFAEQKGKR